MTMLAFLEFFLSTKSGSPDSGLFLSEIKWAICLEVPITYKLAILIFALDK